jgi:DNA-binding transcriptional LysR family regulator
MQLRMLVAVAEESSVQKAAERVYRTPPAVSMALRKLEVEIKARIFDRSEPREHTLTPAGEVLLDYARRMLILHDEALAAIAETKKGRRGTLRIGTNESINLYVLPQLTEVFRGRCPKVKVEVTCDHSDALLLALSERRIDVALVAYRPGGSDLETYPIMTDELVVIMSPEHSLASREILHIGDLGSESIIIEGDSSSLHETIVEAFRRFHTPLHVPVESGTIEAIKRMVERKLGIGIVPRMCVREEVERGQLKLGHIAEFHEERTLWAARRQHDPYGPASQAFMEVIALAAEAKISKGEGHESVGVSKERTRWRYKSS